MQFFPVLVVGFAAALGLTPVSREIAMRIGVVDKPNKRKIHLDNKPLMGGLAIYLAFAISLILFSPPQHFVQMGAVLAGGAFVAFVGFLDDRYNLGIRIRLIAAGLAGTVAVIAGISFQFTGIAWIDYPLTVFWIMAITNAVNFLDNMDGLAAGLAAIAAFFFLVIAVGQGLHLVSLLAAALLGSAVGFLIYNFAPSSTFMGDMGALMLGFVLSVLGVKLDMVTPPLNPTWMIPLLVLILPVFDINLVIFTRLSEGRSPGEAGKDHTSHRLLSLGLSHRQTLFLLYGGCTFFGLVAVGLSATTPQLGWVIAAIMIVLVAALYGVMIWIRERIQKRPTV